MAIGLVVVHNRQNKASTGLAFDYGFTLSRLIADQAAEDLLLEDHVALQAMVKAMTRNRDIALLQISDAAEQVVASTDDAGGGENSIDRKSAVKGKRGSVRVDLGGGRIMKKKKKKK